METVDALIPLKSTTPDGVKWLQFVADPHQPIYNQFKSLPNALKSDGILYMKVSHNSDSFLITYRQCKESDLAFGVN